VGHHHGDFSAEMLFVKTESFRAIAAVVKVGVQFHRAVDNYRSLTMSGMLFLAQLERTANTLRAVQQTVKPV
jgi:hypothetical protein